MIVKRGFNFLKILFGLTVGILILTVTLFQFLSKDLNRGSSIGKEELVASTIISNNHQVSDLNEKGKHFLKIVHLDLKGGGPKMSYFLKVIPLLKEAGANAILIEYEDMFPFQGILTNLSARNAYSTQELRRFVEMTKSLEMELIPLVQTFGHLEYVLKLEEFRHLRELEKFPLEICPSKKESIFVLKEMIRQVMTIHKNSRYIHIGCDEVRHLGVCGMCSRTDPKHVIKIGNHLKLKYPGIIPLIWDDMLRHWTYDEIVDSGLGSVVEPVIWVYGNNILHLVPRYMWSIYSRTFPNLWVASSFKGGFGEKETLPDLVLHLSNNLAWKKILQGEIADAYVKPASFSGIIVTGWSRYDHFAVLCELFPVGLPSLVLNLVFLEAKEQKSGFSKWLRILRCPKSFLEYDLNLIQKENLLRFKLGSCFFPGNDLYSQIVKLKNLEARMKVLVNKLECSGWTSKYNFNKNFTSPWRILEMFPEEGFAGEKLKNDLGAFKFMTERIMREYFDKYTIAEWIEQKIQPIEEELDNIKRHFESIFQWKIWPRRPLL